MRCVEDLLNLALKSEDLKAKLEYCSRYLELNPSDADAWEYLGNVLVSLGRLRDALECTRRAMDLEPDTNYLKAKANLEEPERAVRLYDSVLKKNPLHAGAWLGKGNSLVLLNRYEEAIECFDQAIELSVGRPREREAWFGKGDALCQLGRFEQGIQCFNKALDIDPAYVTAWRRKGGWLAYMGEYRQALTCLYKVLEIAPDHPEEVRLAREIITLIT